MSLCGFAQLVTAFIFFSAWDKSHVKWDNSQNLTQKMRTWVLNNVLVLTQAEKTTSAWLRTQIWVKKVSQFHRKIWPKRQKRTTVFFFSCLFFASLAKKNHQGYHLTPLTMSSIQSHCIQVLQCAIYIYYTL